MPVQQARSRTLHGVYPYAPSVRASLLVRDTPGGSQQLPSPDAWHPGFFVYSPPNHSEAPRLRTTPSFRWELCCVTSPSSMIRIGAGAGYSGDRIPPALELAEHGQLDYLVFECLAERTIALAQLEKAQHPQLGFDPLLRARMQAVLPACVRNRVTIITNMGAANPMAAAHATASVAKELGLPSLKIAVIEGDDVLACLQDPQLRLLENGAGLDSLGHRIISANAYLGTEPIVQALAAGAQIVITGRVADPALFLAPLIHEFGWSSTDWNRLGKGILVGHLLECAAQVTGGYFADPGYRDVPDLARLGFPLAEVDASGDAVITKVEGSGGAVTVHTCTAQLLYEVDNPSQYIQPDVIADFSAAQLAEIAPNRVRVSGARGAPRPSALKVTIGYHDGFIGEGQISYAGPGALARGRLALEVVQARLESQGLTGSEIRYDLIGHNAIHGETLSAGHEPYEVRVRVAVRAEQRHIAEAVANEVEALYLNGPSGGGGATKSIREVVAAASTLLPRERVTPRITYLET